MSEFLKCDAPTCEHVEQVGIITEDMVNTPCPVCGANLLTQADWNDWRPFSKLLSDVRAIEPEDGEGMVTLSVSLHDKSVRIGIET